MHTETINKIKSALSDDNTTLINNELSERNAAEIASIIISFSQNDICRVLKSLSSENLAEIILELPEDIRTGVLDELDNKSILGAIVGQSTNAWFKKTKMGIWFYKKVDNTYNWAAKRYDMNILTTEEKQMKKFPNLKKRLEKLERELNELRNRS